jgi:hypothetical protein
MHWMLTDAGASRQPRRRSASPVIQMAERPTLEPPPGPLAEDPHIAQAVEDLDVVMIRLAGLTREAREALDRLEARRGEPVLERGVYVGTQLVGYGLAIYAFLFDQLENPALLVAALGLIFFKRIVGGRPWRV